MWLSTADTPARRCLQCCKTKALTSRARQYRLVYWLYAPGALRLRIPAAPDGSTLASIESSPRPSTGSRPSSRRPSVLLTVKKCSAASCSVVWCVFAHMEQVAGRSAPDGIASVWQHVVPSAQISSPLALRTAPPIKGSAQTLARAVAALPPGKSRCPQAPTHSPCSRALCLALWASTPQSSLNLALSAV